MATIGKTRGKRRTQKPEANTIVVGPDFVGYIPASGPGINDTEYFRHQARLDEATSLFVKAIELIWPEGASTQDLSEVLRRAAERLWQSNTAPHERAKKPDGR